MAGALAEERKAKPARHRRGGGPAGEAPRPLCPPRGGPGSARRWRRPSGGGRGGVSRPAGNMAEAEGESLESWLSE